MRSFLTKSNEVTCKPCINYNVDASALTKEVLLEFFKTPNCLRFGNENFIVNEAEAQPKDQASKSFFSKLPKKWSSSARVHHLRVFKMRINDSIVTIDGHCYISYLDPQGHDGFEASPLDMSTIYYVDCTLKIDCKKQRGFMKCYHFMEGDHFWNPVLL